MQAQVLDVHLHLLEAKRAEGAQPNALGERLTSLTHRAPQKRPDKVRPRPTRERGRREREGKGERRGENAIRTGRRPSSRFAPLSAPPVSKVTLSVILTRAFVAARLEKPTLP